MKFTKHPLGEFCIEAKISRNINPRKSSLEVTNLVNYTDVYLLFTRFEGEIFD